MHLLPTTFWLLTLASGLGLAALASYVWTRRSVPGGNALFAVLVSISWLLLSGVLQERSSSLAQHVFWLRVQIPAFAALPVCCLLLALSYTMHSVRGWWVPGLFVVPVAGILLHWTNSWHHLYWSRIWLDQTGQMSTIGRTYGVGFWICVAYSYLITGASALVLVHFLVKNWTERIRTLVFLGALMLPSLASLFYVFDWFPLRYLDITPYALTITGFCIVWVIFRYRFQGVMPVAARSVVHSMIDGVIVLDLDRRVVDLNPAAEALLGCRKEKIVGHRATHAFRDWVDLLSYCQSSGPMAGDATLQCGDLHRLCAVSAVDVVRRKHRIGRVITLRDVAVERQASEDLREARQAAEAAGIAKSRFLANMSHEIRTPMNGVVGATELLLDSGLNDEQTELVITAQESAHCLLSIINDILDYSKIDAGRLDLEEIPFDLYRLMGQTIRSMQPVATKKGLELTLSIVSEVPRVIVGDPTRMRQVMANLIGNAIKFTADGGVSIGISRLVTQPGQTRIGIAVKDTGIGIAPDRIGVLFQEFSQADSSVTRNFGGTGLGLAISQRLVEQMGGTIGIESTLGRGSTFTVEVPVRLADAWDVVDSPHVTLAQSEPSPGCRVLLAEDNLVNQKIGQRILEKLGCHVDLAKNGRDAIESTESGQYDVILMDLQMPEVDGLQATREMRLHGIRTPIVALTASVLDETRKACEAAGMDAFITKPIRLDEISSILKQFRGAD